MSGAGEVPGDWPIWYKVPPVSLLRVNRWPVTCRLPATLIWPCHTWPYRTLAVLARDQATYDSLVPVPPEMPVPLSVYIAECTYAFVYLYALDHSFCKFCMCLFFIIVSPVVKPTSTARFPARNSAE